MTEEITKPFSVPMPEMPKPDFGHETQRVETGGEVFLRGARHSIWPAATGLLGGAYSQSPSPDRRLGELEATLRSAIIALAHGSDRYYSAETAKKILEAAVPPKP